MNIKNLKKDEQFNQVVKSIANYWDGGLNLNLKFNIQKSLKVVKISSLKEAYEFYNWPYHIKKQNLPDKIHQYGNTFQKSNEVLMYAKSIMLKSSGHFYKDRLTEGSLLILEWGGVLNYNNKRITNYGPDKFFSLIKQAEVKWDGIRKGDDFSPSDSFDFHSNAGFTKIYSVLFDDFIIYDSRVAAALAFFAKKCLGNIPPDEWRFFIPQNKGDKNKRYVEGFLFSSAKKKHFYSNIISNLLLLEVQSELKKRNKKVGLRQIEAALFMIGYDISNYK
jgi:hypothetical protein